MANHGYLPRNGKNIDLAIARAAISDAFNYEPTTIDFMFQAAIDFNLSTTGNRSTIHLADLRKHDTIEFDGSLSRNDIYFGDNLHFNPSIWATVAEHLNLYDAGPCGNETYVTVESAARARAARVQEAMSVNPTFNNSQGAMTGSPGTTALYLTTLWDDEVEAVPKSWVRAFFGTYIPPEPRIQMIWKGMLMWAEDERIPYIEGYQQPKKPRNATDIFNMNERVLAVKV
jgi:hypothetical protein